MKKFFFFDKINLKMTLTYFKNENKIHKSNKVQIRIWSMVFSCIFSSLVVQTSRFFK